MVDGSRHLAAIMFTDMVGYSALAQADEAAALRLLDRHNRLLRPIFARHRGREVKTVGDAFLVEFESALDAAQCALEVQRAISELNLASPEEWKIRVRIGIHVGDVVPTNGDVLGDAVNIAARIQPLAEPGGICLSQQVYDQVRNKLPVTFERLPPRELKNIQVPVTVYRMAGPGSVGSAPAPAHDAAPGHHLAVLPLSNISPDPGDAYFADGLTEELISVLSQVPDLSVIAHTSVVQYKTQPKPIAQVGAELNVGTVLEGSVRKAGNRLRITLQLIDVPTQRHIWSNSYNREIDDVFAVQTDIAQRTAEALRIELARRDPAAVGRRPTPNLAAYNLYLRGLAATTDVMERGPFEAVRFFEEATQLDPNFADAFASWADIYVIAAGDTLPMREVIPKARALVGRALELDPDSSDAHSALANILFQSDHDWLRAEAEFRRAIALNPSNVVAHRFFGLMLMALARFEEAKELLRRAMRLDPGGYHRLTLALAELLAGEFEAAISDAEQTPRPHADAPGHRFMLGAFYAAAGRWEEARREADRPVPADDPDLRYDHALLNALVGRPAPARQVIAEVERGEVKNYTSPTYVAVLYAAIGDGSRALDLLEKEFREGDSILWIVYRHIYFDGIRQDPRFVALLKAYGLPTDPPARPRPS